MKAAAIIQARQGSTRLPGKTLAQIGDRTLLEWVIHRTQQIGGLDDIIVATTPKGGDNPIQDLCTKHGITCHRSSEQDVLNRYHQTATTHNIELILRITADCPLLDPQLNTQILEALRHCVRYKHPAYTAAHKTIIGFGQEAFTQIALRKAWKEAAVPANREHVVTYMINSPDFACHYLQAPLRQQQRSHWRLTVDTPDDLELMRRLYHTTNGTLFDLTADQIIDTVEANPTLLHLVAPQPAAA